MPLVNQDDLREDLEKYMKAFAVAYCKEGMRRITEMAHCAMREFYNDYTPKYYKRTNNLYDPEKEGLKNGSIIPYYHDNKKRIYGGVRISSKNMTPYQPGTAWETDAADVAWFAWHGYHGHPLRGITMSPSPLEIVKKNMSDKKFLDEVTKYATKQAKSLTYKTFNF